MTLRTDYGWFSEAHSGGCGSTGGAMRHFDLKEDYKFARLRRKRTAFQAEGTAGAKAARHAVTYACTMTRCRELGGVSGDGLEK